STYLTGTGIRSVTFTATSTSTNLTIGYDSRVTLGTNQFWYEAGVTENGVGYFNCQPLDTDNDGIPNHLDLDSDNDGCSDAKEAGSSTNATSTSVYPTGTDTNTNGLLNNYESSTTAGTVNYTSTYTNYALTNTINACTDTDNDGVADLVDLDDDNDGILDSVECPLTQLNTNESNGTFGTAAAPRNLANTAVTGGYIYSGSNSGASQYAIINQTTAFFTAGPGFWGYPGHTTGTATDAYLAVNGNTTMGNFYSESVTLQAGAKYRISFWHQAASVANDYQLAAEVLSSSNAVLATANTGAQNSLGWKLTTVDYTSPSNQTITFIIKNISTNASGNDFSIDDISFTAIGCPDADGDGIPNQLDLDSDNDGCSDANEFYGNTSAQGTDGNSYYGTGNPPAVNADGTVTAANYTGTYTAATTAGSASVITAQPTDQSVAAGANATFAATVTAGSGTTNYQWQVSTNGGSTWTNVTNAGIYSGATTATLTVTGVTSTMNEYRYRLQISQSNFACGNLTTNAARLILANNVTIINDNVSTPEDTPATGNVLTNDTGSGSTAAALTVTEFTVAGLSGTFTAGTTATIPGVGTIVVNANGSFTFTPVANYNGTVPAITYTATDTNGGSGTGTLNITVTPVNDVPVATDDVVSGNEDTPISGNVLTNDTDADGNTLSVAEFTVNGVTYPAGTTASIPGVGTIVVNADGSFTFTPALDYVGDVPDIIYTVVDGNGGSDTGLLDITVDEVNDAPLAANDIIVTPEDVPVTGNVLSNDTDLEGAALTVTQFTIAGISGTFTAGQTATIPGVGTVVVNADGTFTFTPVLDYTGTVPLITYTVSDGNSTDTAYLSLYVDPVNDLPVANNDTNTVNEDNPATGNVLTNDTDTDTPLANLVVTQISFTIGGTTYTYPSGTTVSIPNVGVLIVNTDGTYTFTPNANWNGTVPVITYTVSDGEGGVDTGTLAITVTAVNDSPVAVNDDNQVTPEDTPITGNVLANDSDPEGNPITVSQFTIAGVTGVFTAGQTATIPGVGTIVINSDGSYTFTPAANYSGAVPAISYTAADSYGGSDNANLNITVSPINDAPVATDDVISATEDTPFTGNVLTNDTDPDGNTLTVSQFEINGVTYPVGTTASIPGVGTVIVNADGSFTFTPVANYNGTVPTINYTVTDGQGGSDIGAINITVASVNDTPIVIDESLTTNEDTPLTGNVLSNDSDPDADALTVTQFTVGGQTYTAGQEATIPGVGTIVVNADGSFTFTPAENYNGSVPVITYTVSDGNGGTETGDLAITVAAVNDAPTAIDDTQTILEDTVATGNVLDNDTDPDGNTLTVTQFTINGVTYAPGAIVNIPNVGTMIVNADGTYSFTPVANYNGTVPVVTYTTSDGQGGSDTGTLTIAITPVNDAPVVVSETLTTLEDTPLTGNVLTNDTDLEGNTLTVTQFTVGGQTYTAGQTATIPGVGTIVVNTDGTFTFTPVANYNGVVPVIGYTVSDGTNAVDGSLSIVVTAVNDAPVATDETASTPQNVPATGSVLTNDTDVDGNTLTVTQFTIAGVTGTFTAGDTATIPGVGTLVVNVDGTYTFTPETNYYGPVPVTTYTVSDGNGGTDTGTLSLSVTPVDTDGDGVMDFQEALDNTDPNDPCAFEIDNQELTPSTAWSALDCDGDGTPNGTDTAPLDPCIHAANAIPNPANAIWAAADCDNDGETNGTEDANNTDPNNPCSYTTAPLATSPAYTAWSALDCDGDGTPNGTDTAPLDPCVHAANATPNPANALWQAADCDGDGTPNGTDAEPNNPCVGGSGTPVTTNAIWAAADCDGDGETNGTEDANNTDPNNPCSYTTAPSAANTIWNALDCDNDGVTNGEEILDGTNPLNPDSDGDGNPDSTDPHPTTPTAANDTANASPGSATTINILGNDDFLPNDNNVITQTGGTATGTVSFDPVTGTMTYTPAAGEIGTTVTVVYQVCQGSVCATATVTITVAPADTDGDGVSDVDETAVGTDPTDPCDYDPANQVLADVSASWLAADCDGDGTPNGTDTSPLDPCIYVIGSTPDITNPVWQAADCDGDGLTNNTEGLDDTDGDGIPDFEEVDSDGDGIPDAVEAGPNPNNPIDTDGDGTPDYLDVDSDGDGIPDSVEDSGCTGTAPCTPTDTDGDGTPDYLDVDSDGDGIPDSVEDSGCSGTAPCTPTDTDGDGTPDYLDVDSDGDGIPDSVEDSGCTGTAPCTPTDTDGDGTPDYLDV
ncbi:tandem-95 repeat protein, partial [Flavobacterium sp.]|uniref:tandem-95 repeat protein n=1 Tax=Flavobacterium sp. TaxID=239 RepID=UPI0037BED1B5